MQDRQLLFDVVVKFDEQNRFAWFCIELHQISRGLEVKLSFSLIEQGTIDVFDRGRLEIDERDACLHRFRNRCEEDQTKSFFAREWRDL